MWYLREGSAALTQVGDTRFDPNGSSSGEPGGTETQVFKFVARKKGRIVARLVYAKGKDARNEVTYTIDVH